MYRIGVEYTTSLPLFLCVSLKFRSDDRKYIFKIVLHSDCMATCTALLDLLQHYHFTFWNLVFFVFFFNITFDVLYSFILYLSGWLLQLLSISCYFQMLDPN